MSLAKKVLKRLGIASAAVLVGFYSYVVEPVPQEVLDARKDAATRLIQPNFAPSIAYLREDNLDKKDEYIGVIHCHSGASHDSTGTIDDIVLAAEEAGIDFVIMTEHAKHNKWAPQKEGILGSKKPVIVINGLEISKSKGSILAIGYSDKFDKDDKDQKEIVDEIHSRNGLAIVGHLDDFVFLDKEFKFDGLEIYNPHSILTRKGVTVIPGLINSYFFNPRELVLFPLIKPLDKNFEIWDALLKKGNQVPIVGGNDDHEKWYLPMERVNRSQRFKFMRTHIYSSTFSKSGILNALKNGNGFVAFDSLADSTGFNYKARNRSTEIMQGEWIELDDNTSLYVKLPIKADISVIRHGKVVSSFKNAEEASLKIFETGAYRIKVDIGPVPWIFSNPLYITGNELRNN